MANKNNVYKFACEECGREEAEIMLSDNFVLQAISGFCLTCRITTRWKPESKKKEKLAKIDASQATLFQVGMEEAQAENDGQPEREAETVKALRQVEEETQVATKVSKKMAAQQRKEEADRKKAAKEENDSLV